MNIHFKNKKKVTAATTLELIVTQGIQETPMSQISKVSGVPVGTIYHHFKGKDDIINYIYLELKKEFSQALMAETEVLIDFRLQFIQIWKNLFKYYNSNELKFKFSQHVSHLPIIYDKTKEEGLVYYTPVIDFFE